MDILINNAGITHPSVSILDLDLAYLDNVFNTDFMGVYLCSRRAGKEMVPQKSGCIINISSNTGVVPLPVVVYEPMKSAVNMLTRTLAREWARHGVRVNAIAPGYVVTPLRDWWSHHCGRWQIAYYADRAKGEVELIIMEAVSVSPEGKGSTHWLCLHDDSFISSLSKFIFLLDKIFGAC